MKVNPVRQQGNGDKSPLPAPGTDRSIPKALTKTIKDIVAKLLVNIYSDGPDTPGASSPILDPTTSNLLDRVLLQMERFQYQLLDEVGAEQLFSTYIDIQKVANSVYQDLLSYSGSCENLHLAISACDDHLVKKIASSLAQSLSRSIQNTDYLRYDNLSTASTRLSSLASTTLSTPTSWVTEDACTISEDITLRSVDLISIRSLEMAEDLMDAVMVELYADPAMFGTPQPKDLDWPQLALAELNQAATMVYKHMLEQCGSVENLQNALRSREKQVVTTMAGAIASQTYRLISMKESSGTPLLDQTSNLKELSSISSYPQLSPGQCFIFYQTVWDIISTLLLELCKKKKRGQHLTPNLFLKSLSTLSECPGVKISNDKKQCDISSDSSAIERIVLGAQRRLSEHPHYWSALESLLIAKDEAAAWRVVITVVEEILKFASHPFGVIPVPASSFYHDEAEGEATHGSADGSNKHADLHQDYLDVCSLRAGWPDNLSLDMTPVSPVSVTRGSIQSSAVGSKKVMFRSSTKVDYYSKSQVPSKRRSKMSDEAEYPSSCLRGTRVISVKIKKVRMTLYGLLHIHNDYT